MDVDDHGRRKLTFDNGERVVTSTSITEHSLVGEDETAFLCRMLEKYGHHQGTIEVVFKAGRPDYATITLKHIG